MKFVILFIILVLVFNYDNLAKKIYDSNESDNNDNDYYPDNNTKWIDPETASSSRNRRSNNDLGDKYDEDSDSSSSYNSDSSSSYDSGSSSSYDSGSSSSYDSGSSSSYDSGSSSD